MTLPAKRPLTAERLRFLLHYDPETGSWTWINEPNPSFLNKSFIGQPAGYLRRGRRIIRIDGIFYIAARLAFLYMTGEWPRVLVDHRDCNPSNDSFDNLRQASISQNQHNKRKFANNKSGFKGVHFYRGRWIATIAMNRVQFRLGSFGTAEEAHYSYRVAAEKLYGEFARAS